MTRLALEKSSAGTGKGKGGVSHFLRIRRLVAAFKHVLAWRQKLAGKRVEEVGKEGGGVLRIFSRHGIRYFQQPRIAPFDWPARDNES